MPPLTCLLGWYFYIHLTDAGVYMWINVDRAMGRIFPAFLGYISSLPAHSLYADWVVLAYSKYQI